MVIVPIRTPDDHSAAVARMAELWDAAPESDAAAELDALATLVDAYEKKQLALPEAGPVEVLRYAVTEMGRTQTELAKILGSRSRASEVLSGKRALTVDMICDISAAWGIPAQLLIGKAKAAE
ncbi:MAG TPA: helix-turn-helix domain-containing protein [Methylocystis sp.]|nr:helix-turn-helix domain-containing protein [Methylocystis sp.]